MTAPGRVVLDLGHIRLHALTWGEPDAPLAICLHGFPDSAWTWRHLAPRLAVAGYRVVAPFTRGYAPSEIPDDGDYHVAALAHDVLRLHRELGGDDRAVLIGHDWGALTAHAVLARVDHPFRRVVAIAVPPIAAMRQAGTSGRTRLRLIGRQMAMSWYIAFNQIPFLPERTLGWLIPALWRRWGPTPEADDIDHAVAAVPTRAHGAAVLGYYRAMLRPRVDPRYADRASDWLKPPRTPLLYLHGTRDGCMQVEFTNGLAELLPAGSEVVRIDGAGHFVHLDQRDAVHRRIVGFLRS
ncbi:alpha/beta fold hydrolase [Gordonia sp. SID5947]|uniref:alpha/beta fold hydrolase n=1 Tax=Gordonia sp. SID5947 TaxID=2690315 RepID=UPI00136C20CC|nr:alpha/beta hydrolase [Gordonia sp. SID5947]MYR07244.1 alpha/beta fold hydrolase [Gordonia sp. SID5947]